MPDTSALSTTQDESHTGEIFRLPIEPEPADPASVTLDLTAEDPATSSRGLCQIWETGHPPTPPPELTWDDPADWPPPGHTGHRMVWGPDGWRPADRGEDGPFPGRAS